MTFTSSKSLSQDDFKFLNKTSKQLFPRFDVAPVEHGACKTVTWASGWTAVLQGFGRGRIERPQGNDLVAKPS